MKYDRIIQIGHIKEHNRRNAQRDRIYFANGIAATVFNYAGGGGFVPNILVEYAL